MAAEEKQNGKQQKTTETERVVLAGVELPAKTVVSALAQQCGEPLTKDEAKLLNQLAKAGKIRVWVEVGVAKAPGDKKKAIEALLGEDQPGMFRAPGKSAWAGGIAKRIPEKVALDVEKLD